MKYVETCPCGSRLEIEGWGLRDVTEPVTTFRELHRRHIEAAHKPRRTPGRGGPFTDANRAAFHKAYWEGREAAAATFRKEDDE